MDVCFARRVWILKHVTALVARHYVCKFGGRRNECASTTSNTGVTYICFGHSLAVEICDGEGALAFHHSIREFQFAIYTPLLGEQQALSLERGSNSSI